MEQMADDRCQMADSNNIKIEDVVFSRRFFMKFSVCCLLSAVCCLFCFAQDNFVDPYSFDHTRYSKTMPESIDELAELRVPLNIEIRQVVSQRPSIITDREGNRKVFLGGKLILLKEKNGDMTFFSNGQKYCKTTSAGALIDSYGWDNRGLCTIKNEWGAVTGYEHYQFGGKISSRYDSNMNLTNVYFYDDSNGKGYWEYNLITQAFTRHELGRPVVEKSKSKDGDIIAYWKEDDGFLWKIEMTSKPIEGADGEYVYGENNQLLREVIEGNRTKYDRDDRACARPLEVYDQRGVLQTSYVWSDDRLKKVINYENMSYEKYNDFGGVSEQGYISPRAEEVITYEHTWNGTAHLRADELVYDPLTKEAVVSGKYMAYTAEGKVDEIRMTVNSVNEKWVADIYAQNGRDVPRLGEDILLEDYVYFYEVDGLSVEGIKDFFNTSDYFARSIYGLIQDYKDKDKAGAGLFARAVYGLKPGAGAERGITQLVFYDEQNAQNFVLSTTDPSYEAASLLRSRAQDYLECGGYEQALDVCEEFERAYSFGGDEMSFELKDICISVLNIKLNALEKLGRDEEAKACADLINQFS